jgi:hypothetical protein
MCSAGFLYPAPDYQGPLESLEGKTTMITALAIALIDEHNRPEAQAEDVRLPPPKWVIVQTGTCKPFLSLRSLINSWH